MKLYAIHNSHNCRRVNATIAQLGLEVTVIEPNFATGDLKKPEFLALNPNGKVPTLVDGDFAIWESNAIMQYLASKKPGNTLWPDDAKKRADITRWQFWESTSLSRGTGPFAFEKLFKPMFLKQAPDEVAIERAVKELHTCAPVLNGQLEGRPFITGDTLTLADFSVGACFSYAVAAGLPWDTYTHIVSWWGRLGELPAWQSSAPKM